MKSPLIIIPLFFFLSAASQEFAIENTRENIAYAGLSSPLHCVVNGYPQKSITLTTDNGTVKKYDDSFIFTPKSVGVCYITIWAKTKEGNIWIGTHPYRIRAQPPARAYIGLNTGGLIPKETLLKMGWIRIMLFPYECSHFSAPVMSFSALATLADSTLFTFQNTGAKFSEENIIKLQSLPANATLTFYNISYRMPNDNREMAENIVFQIQDRGDCRDKSFYTPLP